MLKRINIINITCILIMCGMGFVSAQNPAPLIPTIYAKADSGKIIINWTSEAIDSIDDSTGYRDFEGFRIYKSTDGGQTWGGPDDRIYYNGEAKGWNPLAQFDLSVEEDSLFCLKETGCDIEADPPVGTRGTRISGIDPLAPWMNLGENTGLEYTYTDNDVYNGKEYTYAVVSYDMGLRSYELSYVTPDDNSGICIASDNSETMTTKEACCTSNSGAWDSELDRCTYSDCSACSWEELFNQVQDWDVTNPDHFSDPSGNGYASVECDITDINMVTAIPGFYAENVENISFEGVEDADGIILQAEDQTIGNGLKSFMIVNQDDLTKSVYRFEIQASELPFNNTSLTGNVFENYKTSEPSLYVYEIDDSESKEPVSYQVYEMVLSEFTDIIGLLKISVPNVCNTDPVFSFLFDEEACIDLLSEQLLDLPGVVYSDGIGYKVPEYIFNKFQLKFIDDLAYSSNFTDFIDGLKFRFDNSLRLKPSSLNASIRSIKFISGASIDSGNPDTLEFENNDFFSVRLKYGEQGFAFDRFPPYSYKIKFTDTPQYPVYKTAPSNVCGEEIDGEWVASESGNIGPTLLPFEIYNLTTGALVKATHSDFGSQYGQDDDNCIDDCGDDKWCNNGECQYLKGYKDCYWQRNENIAFTDDPVNTTQTIVNATDECDDSCGELQWCSNLTGACEDLAEYTFDLQINFATFGGSPYDSSLAYSAGDFVRRNAMLWRASSSIAPNIEPTSWQDEDGDGINDNPWQPVYGWEDGDEVIIEPTRWYVDGDAWIADLSQIGLKTDIDDDDLSKISVVPNPYFSHSRFDETATSRLMWFTHLPTLCDISIYTVSGELVTILEHNDEFSGQESWDLRSGNGDEVAPGLYIYRVEAGNDDEFKHIGKFAIVR